VFCDGLMQSASAGRALGEAARVKARAASPPVVFIGRAESLGSVTCT
jgi:hypothetical protein